jgi:SAM-dependent methyltransferase
MQDSFWDKHYKDFSLSQPSLFAKYFLEKVLMADDTVVELGCGNGRDGLAIAQRASRYIGLDACPIAVGRFKEEFESLTLAASGRLSVRQANFTLEDFNAFGKGAKRLVLYSRFSLHSIDYDEAERLLNNVAQISSVPWVFVIEARTIFDSLYGKGTKIGRHEYRTDHYRRFIDPDEFLEDLLKRFSVPYFEISKGFAPFGDEDPIVMRAEIHPTSRS